MKDKIFNKELLRFLICGVTATFIDYLVSQLFVQILKDFCDPKLLIVLSTTIGFIVSVVINYLISTFWVYQNVDDSVKTKSIKFILLFALFSTLALLASLLTMTLAQLFFTKVFSINIVSLSILTIIKENGINFITNSVFWAYFVSFCLKTIVGLFINYVTRKYILYKEAK